MRSCSIRRSPLLAPAAMTEHCSLGSWRTADVSHGSCAYESRQCGNVRGPVSSSLAGKYLPGKLVYSRQQQWHLCMSSGCLRSSQATAGFSQLSAPDAASWLWPVLVKGQLPSTMAVGCSEDLQFRIGAVAASLCDSCARHLAAGRSSASIAFVSCYC